MFSILYMTITIKTYTDDNYEFEYADIEYKINKIHPLLEQQREKIINKIYSHCINIFIKHIPKKLLYGNYGIKRTIETMMARFMMTHLSYNTHDPVIVYYIKSYDVLVRDLNNKSSSIDIPKIIKELNLENICKRSFKKLLNYYESNKDNLQKCHIKKTHENAIISLNYNGDIVDVYDKLYSKILKAFNGKYENVDVLIWCLAKRYMMLKSYNNQLAVNTRTLKYLKDNYSVNFELFGSVLNINCSNSTSGCNKYCSMFYDIEKYFSSYGSFHFFEPIKGNYTINPPFDELIIEKSINKLINALSKHNNLRFFVWIPVWDIDGLKECNGTQKKDYGSYIGLELAENSPYLKYKKVICLQKMEYFDYMYFRQKFAANTYLLILDNQSRNNYDDIPFTR